MDNHSECFLDSENNRQQIYLIISLFPEGNKKWRDAGTFLFLNFLFQYLKIKWSTGVSYSFKAALDCSSLYR